MEPRAETVRLEMDYRNVTTGFELPGYRVMHNLGVVRGITESLGAGDGLVVDAKGCLAVADEFERDRRAEDLNA